MDDLILFAGNSNQPLAQEVCEYLNISLGKCKVGRFADGEIRVALEDNIRGKDIFIFQATSLPVNANLMELLIMIDAALRASAGRITAVIPYFGYARQDWKDRPRVPITARLVANLITTAGANRVLTMDLHAGQIQGFFNIPVDHLTAAPVILEYIKTKNLKDLLIVSPDAGGVARARNFAKRLEKGLVIIDKRRPEPNVSEVMSVIGDVEGKDLLIFDDMVDTGGTILKGTQALLEKGARKVLVACAHGVLSRDALSHIDSSPIEELIITNTIKLSENRVGANKLKVLSVGTLFGEAVKRIHNNLSVNSLFE